MTFMEAQDNMDLYLISKLEYLYLQKISYVNSQCYRIFKQTLFCNLIKYNKNSDVILFVKLSLCIWFHCLLHTFQILDGSPIVLYRENQTYLLMSSVFNI